MMPFLVCPSAKCLIIEALVAASPGGGSRRRLFVVGFGNFAGYRRPDSDDGLMLIQSALMRPSLGLLASRQALTCRER